MSDGFFTLPVIKNEPIQTYAPNSLEKKSVLEAYKKMYNSIIEVPLYIGNEKIVTKNQKKITPPHDHKHCIGSYSIADEFHVKQAITTALHTKKSWAKLPWHVRASIFLKAAELLSVKYRYVVNAATMLGQSKTIHQAEIDAACELIDFLRFNVSFASDIYKQQPLSDNTTWNKLEYRPLEGFVYAITPFNFTAIAANLPASAALMGNVVVWKPSDSQMYSAKIVMDVFEEAGLPSGVINLISGDAKMITDIVLEHPDFAGLHYTGSTFVFKNLWQQIGNNIHKYKNYPKIVGETGGKDFIFAHPSANLKAVATGIIRGGFEFQGQKCSAASRIYLPKSSWFEIKKQLETDIKSITVGSPEEFKNFVTAVIHEASFDKLVGYIEQAKKDSDAEIIIGGNYDKSIGYFIQPTVILTSNPYYATMTTELFGPIVTIYLYEDEKWEAVLELIDQTSEYALTGAIYSQDQKAINFASEKLINSAGNLYINDKPTGAVVGMQPFGGARSSGTNDKAGSVLNLLRWVSPRTIKETFVPATDYRYPFLE